MIEVLIDFWDATERCQRKIGDKFSCSSERKSDLLKSGKVKLVKAEKKQGKPPTSKKKI